MRQKSLITGLSIVSITAVAGVIWLVAGGRHFLVDPGAAASQYSQYDGVIYPVDNDNQLANAAEFYNILFDQNKTIHNNEIEYDVKGLKVLVKVYEPRDSPGRLQLDEPQFSWIVDSVGEVNRTREKLERYNPAGIQIIRDSRVEKYKVVKFIVLDPAGNRISVSNNPIYP